MDVSTEKAGWLTDALIVLDVHVNMSTLGPCYCHLPCHTIENVRKDASNVKDAGYMFQTVIISVRLSLWKCQNLPSRTSKKRREVGYKCWEFLEYCRRETIVTTNTIVSCKQLFASADQRWCTCSTHCRGTHFARAIIHWVNLISEYNNRTTMRNTYHVCWDHSTATMKQVFYDGMVKHVRGTATTQIWGRFWYLNV